MCTTYKKRVRNQEYEINKITSSYCISPPIIKYERCNEKELDLYVKELTPLPDLPIEQQQKYEDQLINKCNKLCDLGIYWLDASEDNVVVDLDKNEAFLIDFGLSKFKEQIKLEKSLTFEDLRNFHIKDIRFFLRLGECPPDYFYDENGYLCFDDFDI